MSTAEDQVPAAWLDLPRCLNCSLHHRSETDCFSYRAQTDEVGYRYAHNCVEAATRERELRASRLSNLAAGLPRDGWVCSWDQQEIGPEEHRCPVIAGEGSVYLGRRINKRQRRILGRRAEGVSVAEIAGREGLAVSTVRSAISQANRQRGVRLDLIEPRPLRW